MIYRKSSYTRSHILINTYIDGQELILFEDYRFRLMFNILE
jgi:hypothetical protein